MAQACSAQGDQKAKEADRASASPPRAGRLAYSSDLTLTKLHLQTNIPSLLKEHQRLGDKPLWGHSPSKELQAPNAQLSRMAGAREREQARLALQMLNNSLWG